MTRVNGKDKILLVQPTDNSLGADAYLVGDETEHSHSLERELLDEQTKNGRIIGPGQLSESFDVTFYADTTDPGQEVFVDSIRKGSQIKIWDVEKIQTNGTHRAIFAYVYVESVETSAPTDGFVEVSATVQVINSSKRGVLPTLPDSVLNFGDYEFETPGEKTGEFNGEQAEVVAVTGIGFTPDTETVAVDATVQLTPTIVPVNATNKAVTYESGSTEFATVSPTGLVTGVAEGSSIITATTVDGSKTATVTVTVTA